MQMVDDNSTSNLLHFPAPTPLPTPAEPALLANISTLEVAILATLWNYHPRPLRISEIYLAVRTAAGGQLEPCASAKEQDSTFPAKVTSEDLEKMTAEERATYEMKKALQNPQLIRQSPGYFRSAQ